MKLYSRLETSIVRSGVLDLNILQRMQDRKEKKKDLACVGSRVE